jgi:hypothetical protein
MITPSKNTIKTNAKFADEVYKWFLNRKHGIGSCCGVELDRYYTKKENCDLGNRILDGYCMPTPVIPVPPVCPVECVEGSYATAYFNLLSLAYPIDLTAPTSYISLTFNGTFITQFTVDRSQYYSFSDPATLSVFIDTCNQQLDFNLIPFTLSFAQTIPGAMGYGLVLTSDDKTNIYNDLVANIDFTNLGEPGNYFDFDLDSTINGGVISTC